MQDYLKFYKTEIKLRKMLKYPPFCDIILFTIKGKKIDEVKKIASKIFNNLSKIINKNLGYDIYKPVPSPIDKIQNNYRWRIILKGKVNMSLIEKIEQSVYNINNNKNVSIIVDINPNNMM